MKILFITVLLSILLFTGCNHGTSPLETSQTAELYKQNLLLIEQIDLQKKMVLNQDKMAVALEAMASVICKTF